MEKEGPVTEDDDDEPSQLIEESTFVELSSILRVQISLGDIDGQYGLGGSYVALTFMTL